MGKKSAYARIEIHKLFDKTDEIFEDYIKNPELKKHCLEVEIIMRTLANKLGEDEAKWAAAGKLHDLDYEDTKDNIELHGRLTADRLKKLNYPQELIHAILAHNKEHTRVKMEVDFDYCLAAADSISGLIYAYGLVRKGLKGMKVSGLKKKIEDKTFASAIRRDSIYAIEKVMKLDDFLETSIQAMQSIAKEIGFG